MKKKGFTLVEIIAVIGILAVIGTVSFFGVRLVNKNIKISKLEQITDRVLQAAEVYIETNKETKTELYNNKNSVVIPLNALINEGLMDLKGTTLEDKDIENEYVVSAFTSKSAKENCVDITTSTSWNLSKENPFYICSNESGTSNSIIIGGTTNNADRVQKTTTNVPADRSYVTYKGNGPYRILYVETDDSLVIYTSEDTFGDVIKSKTQPLLTSNTYNEYTFSSGEYAGRYLIDGNLYNKTRNIKYYGNEEKDKILKELIDNESKALKDLKAIGATITNEEKYDYRYFYVNGNFSNDDKFYLSRNDFSLKNSNEYLMNIDDIIAYLNKLSLVEFHVVEQPYRSSSANEVEQSFVSVSSSFNYRKKISSMYYVKGVKANLLPCIKIASGTGTSANPYTLDDSSC